MAAGAGDLDRAEALARAITDPDRQARALADLAQAAAGAGDLDRAEAAAAGRSPTRTGRRGCWRTWPRRRRGRVTWTGPRRWPEAITDPDQRARVLADLAEAVAGAGDLDRAAGAAQAITDPDQQARVLADLAQATAGAGDLDRAEALAGQAEAQPGRSPTRTGRRGRWRTWRGRRRGRVTWTGPRRWPRSITIPDQQARALADLAQGGGGGG